MKTLKADERQRVRLPDITAGQVFAYEPALDGSIRLIPVAAKPEPKRVTAKLVRRGKHLVFEAAGLRIDPEAVAQAVREERESR